MTEPHFAAVATLAMNEWIRFADGEVGMIRDKVDHPGYQKSCVEVPGSRNRIVPLAEIVEHLPNHRP